MTPRRRDELAACPAVPRPGEAWLVEPLVIECTYGDDPESVTDTWVCDGCPMAPQPPPAGRTASLHGGWGLTMAAVDDPCHHRVGARVPTGTRWRLGLWPTLPWYFGDGRDAVWHDVVDRVLVLVTAVATPRGTGQDAVQIVLGDAIKGWAQWASMFTTWRRPV